MRPNGRHSTLETMVHPSCKDCDEDIMVVNKTEEGVVPIFGGISWTSHQIKQIWYPSNDYHDQKGVLTGAYNFAKTAYNWGKISQKAAEKGARRSEAIQ